MCPHYRFLTLSGVLMGFVGPLRVPFDLTGDTAPLVTRLRSRGRRIKVKETATIPQRPFISCSARTSVWRARLKPIERERRIQCQLKKKNVSCQNTTRRWLERELLIGHGRREEVGEVASFELQLPIYCSTVTTSYQSIDSPLYFGEFSRLAIWLA